MSLWGRQALEQVPATGCTTASIPDQFFALFPKNLRRPLHPFPSWPQSLPPCLKTHFGPEPKSMPMCPHTASLHGSLRIHACIPHPIHNASRRLLLTSPTLPFCTPSTPSSPSSEIHRRPDLVPLPSYYPTRASSSPAPPLFSPFPLPSPSLLLPSDFPVRHHYVLITKPGLTLLQHSLLLRTPRLLIANKKTAP